MAFIGSKHLDMQEFHSNGEQVEATSNATLNISMLAATVYYGPIYIAELHWSG